MSDNEFGGRISATFDDLRLSPTDADIVLDVSTITTESKANHDGTAAYMAKPKLPGADIKFRNRPDIDWNLLLRKQGDFSIVEHDTGRTHFFTGAKLIGAPKENTATGEVDGLRIEGGVYRRVNG